MTAKPQSLLHLLPFLRPYYRQLAFAIVALCAAATATLLFPIGLKNLIDQGIVAAQPGEQLLAMRQYFFALFLIALAVGVFSALRFYLMSWLGERVTADIRSAVYSHVLKQSPAFFETTQTGEVLSRLSADTTLVQTVVGSSFSMGLRSAVTALGALVMLIWSTPYVMLQVLLGLIFVVFPALLFGRRVRRLSRASQDRMADTSAIASEALNAVTVVQSYNAEQREAERFRQASETAFNTARKRARSRAFLTVFITTAVSAALIWGLYQGTQAVIHGDISAGELGQTVFFTLILASSAAVLGEVYGDVLRAAGASERLIELLHTQSPIQSPEEALTPSQREGAIRFHNISFHYPSRPQQAALYDFNLEVKAGQTVALVGPSGAGKSTVFQLLLRFYDPSSGEVRLDGTKLSDMTLTELRSRIAIVPQDAVIFAASALENIRYGRPSASNEEVRQAAQAAFAADFIEALPQGYDSFLGERGVRLSGGQRQRIAIARAILKSPPLLLLDEATSALDAESEKMVQKALESAAANRTTIVIAHRLSTVKRADVIVVIDKGQIVETGTHQSLVNANGVYARLAALSFNQDQRLG